MHLQTITKHLVFNYLFAKKKEATQCNFFLYHVFQILNEQTFQIGIKKF